MGEPVQLLDEVGSEAGPASPPRRRRRTRSDVETRIHEAARALFAERGYQATTTREIARRADVSETLLFRYHGDKASLFQSVVIQPFHQLMDEFVTTHEGAATDSTLAGARLFTRRVYELFESNAGLFRALLGEARPSGGDSPYPLAGLAPFFARSVAQVEERWRNAERQAPYDLMIGTRLGFGMIAASVLLGEHLFFDASPDREAVISALEHIVVTAISGPPSIDGAGAIHY